MSPSNSPAWKLVWQNASVLHIKGPRLRDEIARGKITQPVANPETSLSSFSPKLRLTGEPYAFNTAMATMPRGLPRRTGPAGPSRRCALLQQSLLVAKDRPQPSTITLTACNSLHPLPRVLQSQAFTFRHHAGPRHARWVPQGGRCWLHDGATSVSVQETPAGWSRQHICPAVPWAICRFYASEQMFPMSNQESSAWTKPTHPNIYSTLYKFLNSYSNPKCAHWTMLSYFSNSYTFK